jgi:uncharacterized protein
MTTLTPDMRGVCEQALEELVREIKGVRAVVISTEDGFEVASRVENTAQINRLSAMASALAALGALAGEESLLGACDTLVMQAAHGFIAIVQVHRTDVSLIVSVVTGRDAVTGQVLYLLRKVAQILQDH